jgi:hypothetical protein
MHGAFIAERDARAAQRERDAIKKTGGSGRKSTGDPTSGSNVRVSYAAAALITQGKKLKPGAPTPGFFMPSSVAPTAEPSAINVVPRKAAPKKVNFDTLQVRLLYSCCAVKRLYNHQFSFARECWMKRATLLSLNL